MNIYKKIFQLAVKSRKFQMAINSDMKLGKFTVPIHLAFGHEFVASIVRANFHTNKDSLILTHRNIHFTSIFSKNAKKNYNYFKKEIYSKKENYGSMNYFDSSSDIRYTSSILGNNFSVSCGVAESNRNSNSLVICVAGDGAIEEGSFYESLTLAKYLKLRVVFIVENNNWSMATTIRERRCSINLKKLANSIGVDYAYFGRNDIIKNIKKYDSVIKTIKKKSNPIICEFDVQTIGTYKNNQKIIKYHHGPMRLTFKDKIYIKNNNEDILYLMSNALEKKL